ncbi:MAG TPA: hypothetical protein VE223_03990, partial [Nitrososphaeraceae archaeon]|nr:hypothetical protein [Nitrososphaeraceae archaeon]
DNPQLLFVLFRTSLLNPSSKYIIIMIFVFVYLTTFDPGILTLHLHQLTGYDVDNVAKKDLLLTYIIS